MCLVGAGKTTASGVLVDAPPPFQFSLLSPIFLFQVPHLMSHLGVRSHAPQ